MMGLYEYWEDVSDQDNLPLCEYVKVINGRVFVSYGVLEVRGGLQTYNTEEEGGAEFL
jgi:hypothetical protein